MDFLNQHKTFKRSLLTTLVAVFLLGGLLAIQPVRSTVRVTVQTVLAHASKPTNDAFPTIDKTELTPLQQKILAINTAEYAKKPISYDATVLTYTQGSKEAWCADYATWVLNQAGVPLVSPYSGSWRIPGVYTLQEYFQSTDRYKKVGTYTPKLGDIAIYSHGQGHAAIVLAMHGSTITSIGGNESGRLRIDTRPQVGKGSYDLIGYGILGE
jgi:hypothetical protein